MATECHIVVIVERAGKRVGYRHKLHIPVAAARGKYEDLSDRALKDMLKDLWHEQRRRGGLSLDQPEGGEPEFDRDAAPTQKYDPHTSQFTGEA